MEILTETMKGRTVPRDRKDDEKSIKTRKVKQQMKRGIERAIKREVSKETEMRN
jgi:hypothetical protein